MYQRSTLRRSLYKVWGSPGSILNPLLFLIYINDISRIADYATSRMYAYDTNMTFTACGIPELRHSMSVDLQYLQQWPIASRLTLNILRIRD